MITILIVPRSGRRLHNWQEFDNNTRQDNTTTPGARPSGFRIGTQHSEASKKHSNIQGFFSKVNDLSCTVTDFIPDLII